MARKDHPKKISAPAENSKVLTDGGKSIKLYPGEVATAVYYGPADSFTIPGDKIEEEKDVVLQKGVLTKIPDRAVIYLLPRQKSLQVTVGKTKINP